MSEEKESRKKERSPNFPFIPLAAALDRAQKFYEIEKRNAAPFMVAAKHWGYSPTSSGALQTAAALKSYGLMSDEGSGLQRKLRLTDLALRILLDNRPESIEREQFKRQAAMSPNTAVDVYEQWPDTLPSDSTLIHHLVLERGFNQTTAIKVARIIQENDLFTKHGATDTISDNLKIEQDITLGQIGVERVISAETASKMNPLPGGVVIPSTGGASAPNVERIIGPTGNITVQFAGAPTFDAYQFLEEYIKLRKKLLKPNDTNEGQTTDKEGKGEKAA